MTVMPKVLWKNGVRYGSEWVELEIGPDFTGTVLFKNNKDGTATLQGFLQPIHDLNQFGQDVVLFVPPTGYKFYADSSQKIHFCRLFSDLNLDSYISLKPAEGLKALHGSVGSFPLTTNSRAYLGLDTINSLNDGMIIKIQKG